MRDPKILAFMKKVSVMEGHPDWEDETVASMRNRIEVTAKGKTFVEDKARPRGGSTEGVSDEELENKFRHNASRVLTETKIEGAVRAIWNLEKMKDISELVDQITL